jgi:hypothetical protein
MATMPLFYILQKVISTEAACFLKIYFDTSFQDSKLSDAGVAPTSKIHYVHHVVMNDCRKWPPMT